MEGRAIGRKLKQLAYCKDVKWDEMNQEPIFGDGAIDAALVAMRVGQALEDGRATLTIEDETLVKILERLCKN